jgi:Tfp pilus assembly protein PilN
MIKINLLPRTINEKAAIRNTAIVFAVVLVAVVVGGLTFSLNLANQVSQKESEAQTAEAWQKKVEDIQKQASDQRSSIKPIKDKLDFISAVLKFNGVYPKLYSEVARWTYEKVMYTGMACDGTQLVISARTKNLDYLGRYLLNMYRATDLFTEVTISGVPGYGKDSGSLANAGFGAGMPGTPPMAGPSFTPSSSQPSLAGIDAISSSMQRVPSQKGWIDFTVVCKLKTAVAAPSFAAAGGTTAPAAAPGGMPASGP